jgi:hypothetical protein
MLLDVGAKWFLFFAEVGTGVVGTSDTRRKKITDMQHE